MNSTPRPLPEVSIVIFPKLNNLPIIPCLTLKEVICLKVEDLKSSEIIPDLPITLLFVIAYIVDDFVRYIIPTTIIGIIIVYTVINAITKNQKYPIHAGLPVKMMFSSS